MAQSDQFFESVQHRFQWLKEMREEHPVWLDTKSGFWHVFRYRDVYKVITDFQTFSSERKHPGRRPKQQTIITMDPPEHRQYRNLVSSSFTPQAMADITARIETITQSLLDKVRTTGFMDIVSDLAYPLPASIIAEILGLSAEDLPLFKYWSDGLFALQQCDEEILHPDEHERIAHERARWGREMADYFMKVLRERQHESRDDLISSLIAAEVGGAPVSAEDIVSFCLLLLPTGYTTVTNLLSQAIYYLDAYPDVMEQLKAHRELMPGAVEELLRYISPSERLIRITKVDVAFDDIIIPKGSPIFAWLSSANRDGEYFEEPEHLDITRSPNKHLAFGHGVHFCIGAPLARLEISIALSMMLEQLSDIHLALKEPLKLGRFGLQHLPITFTPALNN